jgi:hypothetical protein
MLERIARGVVTGIAFGFVLAMWATAATAVLLRL